MTENIMSPKSIERRKFLHAAGVSIGLPFLPSLRSVGAESQAAGPKKRMVCIGNMLGFYPPAFWPQGSQQPASSGLTAAEQFEWGRTTAALKPLQKDLTVISGLDHGLKGGHFAIHAFLSGVRQVDAKSMPLANMTVDQYAAEFIPGQTRFPTLTIGSESGIHGGCQMAWTRSGTRVPPIPGPQQLFNKLFVSTDPSRKAVEKDRFRLQESILDVVLDNARDLKRDLNSQDRNKLDEYLSSVRDVEQRIQRRRNWVDVPKPQAPMAPPQNRNMVEDLPLLYDLMVLALQTDSTRIMTLEIGGDFNPNDLGIRGGYHAFSHHGQQATSIEALVKLESYQIEQFARFIKTLAETRDEVGSLLDQTAVLFGSGMGNANSHTNTNLPLILAGGGFRHGRWLAYNMQDRHRPPLTNLFVSLLQNFGAETDQFATSTGTLRGLI